MSRCDHISSTPMKQIKEDGSIQIYGVCDECGFRIGGYKHSDFNLDTLPLLEDNSRRRPPCVVCGCFGTQVHHWAPQAIFGIDEADRWPISYLCRPCHRRWHELTHTNGPLRP